MLLTFYLHLCGMYAECYALKCEEIWSQASIQNVHRETTVDYHDQWYI